MSSLQRAKYNSFYSEYHHFKILSHMEYSHDTLPNNLRNDLINYVYDIIACMHEVHNNLGNGLPEYVYQEALVIELINNGFKIKREYTHHPVYKGVELTCIVRMDIVVEMPRGNVIIECKAISELTDKERSQILGYLRATEFPIGILVNFGTRNKAQIERYYYKNQVVTAF